MAREIINTNININIYVNNNEDIKSLLLYNIIKRNKDNFSMDNYENIFKESFENHYELLMAIIDNAII